MASYSLAELTLGLNPSQFNNTSSVTPKMIKCKTTSDETDAALKYSCSTVMNKLEINRIQDYLKSLEEERRKIEAFKRELPICMQLLSAAIETSKEQLSNYQCNQYQQKQLQQQKKSEDSPSSNCSADHQKLVSLIDKSTDHDKFLSLKRSTQINDQPPEAYISPPGCSSKSVSDAVEKIEERESLPTSGSAENSNHDEVMQSSLYNYRPLKRRAVMCFSEDVDDSNGDITTGLDLGSSARPKGAFLPFSSNNPCGRLEGGGGDISPSSNGSEDRNRSADHSGTVSTSSGNEGTNCTMEVQHNSTANNAGSGAQSSHTGQRKQRRCWSPELHKKFVNALQQLGGSEVATPKMIREVMQVDGLTNDEVKSHLQKYRLHTRGRPNTGFQATGGQADAAPQLVLLGGIWVPTEYNPVLNQSPDALYKLNSGKLVNHQPELNHRESKPVTTSPNSGQCKPLHQYNQYFHDQYGVTPRALLRPNSKSASVTYESDYSQHQNATEPSPSDSEHNENANANFTLQSKSCKNTLRVNNCNTTNHVSHQFGSQQFLEDLQRQQKDVPDLYTSKMLAPAARSKWRYNANNIIQGDF